MGCAPYALEGLQMTEHAKAFLGLDVNGFMRGVSKARAGAKSLGKSLKGALGFFGLAFAVKSMIRTFSDFANKLTDTSRKLGISTEFLQAWNLAAAQNGIRTDQSNIALQRFARRIGEAARGQGVLAATIAENNIQLRDNEGRMRSTTDILGDYADVVQGAESQQERLRLSFMAFDSEGAALVTVLQNGSEGMQQMIRDAHNLSAVTSQRALVSINRLTTRLRVFAIQGVGYASEKLGSMIEFFETGFAGLGALSAGASIDEAREIVQEQMKVQNALADMAVSQQAISAETQKQVALEKQKVGLIEQQQKAQKALQDARGDRSRSTLEDLATGDVGERIRQHAATNRQRFRAMQQLRQRAQQERRRGNGGRAGQLEQQATGLQRLIQAGSGINQQFLRNEQMRARAVLQLEELARQQAGVGLFQSSQRLFDRAASIRENIASLNTGEQRPMANLENAAEQTTAELVTVNRELTALRAQISEALR